MPHLIPWRFKSTHKPFKVQPSEIITSREHFPHNTTYFCSRGHESGRVTNSAPASIVGTGSWPKLKGGALHTVPPSPSKHCGE